VKRLVLATCAAFVLAGCAASAANPRPAPTGIAVIEKPATSADAAADHFAMAPARLEKGHIFMRRTEDWAKVRRDIASEAAQKERQAALKGNIREYIQPDGTIVRKQGTIGHEYEQQIAFLPPHEWIGLKDARLSVHVENKPFEEVIEDALREVLPYTGPWRLQWKISRDNQDVLSERFSLNTETTFGKFITQVAGFMLNHRGLELVFEQFDKDRIIIISDKQ